MNDRNEPGGGGIRPQKRLIPPGYLRCHKADDGSYLDDFLTNLVSKQSRNVPFLAKQKCPLPEEVKEERRRMRRVVLDLGVVVTLRSGA